MNVQIFKIFFIYNDVIHAHGGFSRFQFPNPRRRQHQKKKVREDGISDNKSDI
jgi:hypothetical protein